MTGRRLAAFLVLLILSSALAVFYWLVAGASLSPCPMRTAGRISRASRMRPIGKRR